MRFWARIVVGDRVIGLRRAWWSDCGFGKLMLR
jgi:hypothetical protein